MSNRQAVVLLSGGQDSTTIFYQALASPTIDVMRAISFDYRQKHRVEFRLAHKTADENGVPWELIDIGSLAQISHSSLTDENIGNATPGSAANVFAEQRGLPPSFTPGRNLLFFSYAAAYAAKIGADTIITGVCQQDRSGYPDCRGEFVAFMEAAIRSGFDWQEFRILAPLMFATKMETWQLASELGVLPKIVEGTISCYEGEYGGELHEWGYGCGECGACIERAKGWDDFQNRPIERMLVS